MGWLNNRPLCLWLYDNMILISRRVWVDMRENGIVVDICKYSSLRAIVYYVQVYGMWYSSLDRY
jgi:hypothetical protein